MSQSAFDHQKKRLFSFLTLLAAGICFALPLRAEGKPPEGIPADAQPFQGLKNDKLEAWTAGNRLFLILTGASASAPEGISIARLANVVKRMSWQPEAAEKPQLQPEPAHWLIKAGELPKDGPTIIVMELDEPARVFDESIVSKPDSDNKIVLPAKHAITHGSLLRFEPQPHKNTIGYWANEKDTAEWHFPVQKSGEYEVDILQGCGKGHGGSQVEVQIEDQTLTFDVQETGHFQNFVWRTLGTVKLRQTEKGTLRLIPLHKAAGAVMDVRSVRLTPAGTKRSFESELQDPAALPKSR